ncbi:MAG: aldo/keto reductase [Cyanobacteria bacterium P01_F01_bin.33]
MRYRRFGRTELPMPVFSCGGMRYQQKWQEIPWSEVTAENQTNLEATIQRAQEVGITHVETARGYGSSEMQLGRILPKLPRDRLIVQTKLHPTEDPREFLKTFDKSYNYLQLDTIDLLGIHGINTPERLHQALRPGGCVDTAYTLVAQGKVRFVGFSTHGPLDIILETIQSGRFDYINLHWYYINQDNWPAIAAAKQQDMGVFIISPSDKGGRLYDPPPKLMELCRPLSPMAFNDLFCLSHPEVHTLSLGAAKPSNFDEHLSVLPLLDKADAILPDILARLKNEAIATLGEDWVKTWRVGLPSPEHTPGNINIPTILWLYNLARAFDMVEFARGRYNLLSRGSHWFPGNKAQEISDRELAACLEKSPNRDRIPHFLREAHELLDGEAVKRLSQS